MSSIPPLAALDAPLQAISRSEVAQCVGEVCAAAIAISLVVFDGVTGLAAAIAVMGTLAGIHLSAKF